MSETIQLLRHRLQTSETEARTLAARVKFLESLLKCLSCGHLRHEHEDGPCYGGRTPDMAPGEGEYCMCDGFESELDVIEQDDEQ